MKRLMTTRMMVIWYALLVVLVLGLFFSIWGPDILRQGPWQDRHETRVVRHVDTEAGVVCWFQIGAGVSCLPLSATQLAQPEAMP